MGFSLGPDGVTLVWQGDGGAPALTGPQQVALRHQLAQGGGGDGGGGGGGGGGAASALGMPLTSTTITDLPEWLKPFAQDFISAYAGLALPGGHPAQMPADMNQVLAGMTPQQQQALMSIYGLSQGGAANLSTAGARNLYDTFAGKYLDPKANPYLSQTYKDTLSGKYLDPKTNPYLKATYDAAAAPMIADYQTAVAPGRMVQAQHAGQFGGSAYNQMRQFDEYSLGRNLSDLGTNIYGQNYQQERGRQAATAQDYMAQYGQERQRMMQGLTITPELTRNLYTAPTAMLGAGSFQQEQDQLQNDTAWQNAVRANEYPFTLLSGLGAAIGQAGGGTGTATSTTNLPNASGGQGTGSILGLAGLGISPQILQFLGQFLGGGSGGGGGTGGSGGGNWGSWQAWGGH